MKKNMEEKKKEGAQKQIGKKEDILFDSLKDAAHRLSGLIKEMNAQDVPDINEWSENNQEAQWLSLICPDTFHADSPLPSLASEPKELWEVCYRLAGLFQNAIQIAGLMQGLVASRDGEVIDFCIYGRLTSDNYPVIFGQPRADPAQKHKK